MSRILFLIFSFLILFAEANPINRNTSYPYISGDTFRLNCDFIFDEFDRSLSPSQVQDGHIIFVKTDYLRTFFSRVHPRIKAHYVLVTHNSDFAVPGKFASYLDDEKLIAWFGQNVEGVSYPKLFPIPIGIANRCWNHGNIERIHNIQKQIPLVQKKTLLYMNFLESTCFTERNRVRNMFLQKHYCLAVSSRTQEEYLLDLASSKFVLCPRGNGLDCHRTWECLLMGAIPIVKTSPLDPLFEDLPVLIVRNWEDISEEFLNRQYEEMQAKAYRIEKIYAQYWLDLIKKSIIPNMI